MWCPTLTLNQTERKDVSDALLALSEPSRIVVEQEPCDGSMTAELLRHWCPAKDETDQFPGRNAPLRGAKNDIAGNGIGIINQTFG